MDIPGVNHERQNEEAFKASFGQQRVVETRVNRLNMVRYVFSALWHHSRLMSIVELKGSKLATPVDAGRFTFKSNSDLPNGKPKHQDFR